MTAQPDSDGSRCQRPRRHQAIHCAAGHGGCRTDTDRLGAPWGSTALLTVQSRMRSSGAASCFSSQAPGRSRSIGASSQRKIMSFPRRETSARRDHPDKRRTLSMPLIRCARFTPRLATFEGRITVISYVSSICLTVSGIFDEDQPRTARRTLQHHRLHGRHIDHCRIPPENDRFTDRLSQPVTKSRTVCTPRSSAPPSQHHPGAERCRPSIRPYPARSVTSVASRARWWSHPGHHTAPR